MTRKDKLITPLDSVWSPPPVIEEGMIPDGPNAAETLQEIKEERMQPEVTPEKPEKSAKPSKKPEPHAALDLLDQIDAMAANGTNEMRNTIRHLTGEIRKVL